MGDTVGVNASPPPGTPPRSGWYLDPWNPSQWRWWDGWTWTVHVMARAKKPLLPGWLSIPVLLASFVVVPLLMLILFTTPLAVVLSAVPLLIVLPVMRWLDRVEPEPQAALLHAFLWGATISVVVAATINSVVGMTAGKIPSMVISAPIIEEAMKAGGILWAVRRRDVDGPMDGIVYAGWTAIGFAVVEDIEYFASAETIADLATTFVVRGLLTPFAHPLFTAWTGLAIGRAVSRGRPVFPAMIWGYALAVFSHMLWNGSLTAPQVFGDLGAAFLLRSLIIFVALFFTFAIVLYRVRRQEERRFIELVPWLAQRYRMSPHEIAMFGNFSGMLIARQRLPAHQRRWFDRVHAALGRLAVLHDRPQGVDPATEQALFDQLQRARMGLDPQ